MDVGVGRQVGEASGVVGASGAEGGQVAAHPVGWRDVAPWGLALVVATVGTAIDYDAPAGVNWGIWTTVVAGGLLWVAARRHVGAAVAEASAPRGLDPVGVWALVLAILVAWGAAVTDNPLFEFFIFVSCVVLLAVGVRVAGAVSGRAVGAAEMARAPFAAFGASTVEAGRRVVRVVARARDERRAAFVRGVILAVPVAAVFALILTGADPTLSVWRSELWTALTRLDVVRRLAFFLGTGTVSLGAYGLAMGGSHWATPPGARAEADAGRARLGATERRVIVGAVAAVFGGFLALQPTYLFRDVHALRVSGETYAEYAHRGFTELTIAATLAIVLVVALERYTARAEAGRPMPQRAWATLLLIGEVLVVLASAFHRLTLYESAYGYTVLRLYVQAYVIGVAITLNLLAVEVAGLGGAFDARRAARRTAVVAVAFLLIFSYGNPESWVVSRNMARYRISGDIDVDYLASLSLNAAPAVVAALPALPSACVTRARTLLSREHGWEVGAVDRQPWYAWNLRRRRGVAALRAAGIFSAAPLIIDRRNRVAGCFPTAVEQ